MHEGIHTLHTYKYIYLLGIPPVLGRGSLNQSFPPIFPMSRMYVCVWLPVCVCKCASIAYACVMRMAAHNYVCLYVWVGLSVCVCMCAYGWCICSCMCVCMYACVWLMYVCLYVCVFLVVCMFLCVPLAVPEVFLLKSLSSGCARDSSAIVYPKVRRHHLFSVILLPLNSFPHPLRSPM